MFIGVFISTLNIFVLILNILLAITSYKIAIKEEEDCLLMYTFEYKEYIRRVKRVWLFGMKKKKRLNKEASD